MPLPSYNITQYDSFVNMSVQVVCVRACIPELFRNLTKGRIQFEFNMKPLSTSTVYISARYSFINYFHPHHRFYYKNENNFHLSK